MRDKTIPDSVEPRLESFYPPFVADIDLPHQGVVDSYNLCQELCAIRLLIGTAILLSICTYFGDMNIQKVMQSSC